MTNIPIQDTARLTTLKNGFRIASDHMPGFHTGTIAIRVLAGGRDETSSQIGLAHFLEHMSFKGTSSKNSLQITSAIEDAGGTLNAWTSKEMTSYTARMLKDDIPLAVDIFAEIILDASLDPECIDQEREVILQEIRRSEDNPENVAYRNLYRQMWSNQPLGKSILGPSEKIAKYNSKHLRKFHTAIHQPEKMLLVAAGGVDHDTLVDQARKWFNDLPRQAKSRKPAKAHWTGGEQRLGSDQKQAQLMLALESPCKTHATRRDAGIFAAILGNGMSSRLFQNVREKHSLCYGIHSWCTPWSDTGAFTFASATDKENTQKLLNLSIDEIRRLAEDVTEAEVTRKKIQAKASLLKGLESTKTRCRRMTSSLASKGKLPSIQCVLDKIEAITLDSVRAAGQAMLTGSPLVASFYGPVEKIPDLDTLQARITG